MRPSTLIVGASGYIGRNLQELLSMEGHVVGTSRRVGSAVTVRNGRELDAVLSTLEFNQVVFTPQLSADGIDDLLRRVDGPRWLVLSSAQLSSINLPPGAENAQNRERRALEHGATVLRPTMVFGRGRDQNVTRLIRWIRRWRVIPALQGNRNLIQPIHVDDLAMLVHRHRSSPAAGLFDVAGDEPVSVAELVDMVGEISGVRPRPIEIPEPALRLARRWLHLRPDQIARLTEDKTAEIGPAKKVFGWTPLPLPHRLEQAAAEARA